MRPVPYVRDMMNRGALVVPAETRMGEVAEIFSKKGVHGAAVVDRQEHFLGIISAQGLMNALVDYVYEEVPPGPVKGYLDADSPTLTEEAPLMAAVELFIRSGHSLWAIPVLRGSHFVGVVTRLEVIRAVLDYMAGARGTEAETLYLSALKEIDEKPALGAWADRDKG